MSMKCLLAAFIGAGVTCGAIAAQISMDNTSANDKDFIEYAGEVDLAEIQLGQLAQTKASNFEIKNLGSTIGREHAADLKTLTAVANKIGGIAPNSLDTVHKNLVRKLSTAGPGSFDRQFLTAIIGEHEKMVASFKREAEHGFNKDLRAYAARTLPGLEKHLQQAQQIEAKEE